MKNGLKRNSRISFALFLFISLITTSAFAQSHTVSGVVKDKSLNEPIIGASIVVKGTTNGTITDMDGKYSLKASPNATLVVSFVGYKTVERKVANESTINFTLSESSVMMDEVVAIGYGVQKKKELTGAVAQVKSDDMLKVVGSDFTKTLQGKVAGLSVTEANGRPGEAAVIQIRGVGSILGNTTPLYVVDGIPADGNPNLPAEEIESIDVLKDGAAASVYGTRASNGVILITTKKGKVGKTAVDFTAYYGIQNITSGTSLLNTPDHIFVDEMKYRYDNGVSPILYYSPTAMDYNTDFVKSITKDNAPMQNYNISLNGGSDALQFNINANYYNQDGIMKNSGYERFSSRANASFKKGNFSAFVSIGLNHSNKSVEPYKVYQYAQFNGPYRPPVTLDGSYTFHVIGQNPDHVGRFAKILNDRDRRYEDSHSISSNLKYEFFKGLTYQINIGYNNWNYKRNYFEPQFLVYSNMGEVDPTGSQTVAKLTRQFDSSDKLTFENVLNFDKTFGMHRIGVMFGYTIEKSNYSTDEYVKQNFISNETDVMDAGTDLISSTGSKSKHNIIGKLFRLQYTFADKYMFSGSGRYDGSSRMSKDNRYAFFPGVSIGWNINEEKFLKNVDWLTNLKLRASYGEVGNEGIGDYRFSSYIYPNVDYVFGCGSNENLALGAIQRGYSNKDIKWETNVSRNVGLDLSLWNGKFTFTADIYKNTKKNMLLNLLLPASSGTNINTQLGKTYNSITCNVGDMVNKGIELSASYKGKTNFGMNYSLTGTFTKNKNEVTSLGGLDKIECVDSKLGSWLGNNVDAYTTYMKEGYPAGSFFLIKTQGTIKNEEQLAEAKKSMKSAKLGDIFQVDQNNDGQINDEDRVYCGSGLPKFESSLTLDLEYKGFDFSTQLFYSNGNKVYDGAKQFAYAGGRHQDLYYMWTPANPTSNIPVFNQTNCNVRLDYFLTNGDFLRFRNITLGYTLPKSLINGILQKARIYITAQNPFTITKYEGYDPEVGGDGVTTRGIDKGSYPITRKFLAGVQISF